MNYNIRPAARRDPARYWRIIRTDSPNAAERFLEVAEQTFAKIARHPDLLGHDLGFRRHAGVRSFRMPPPFERYLIFFERHPRSVEFKRVIHGARHLPRLFRPR
jgi:plasmid stabilization system protein ParE